METATKAGKAKARGRAADGAEVLGPYLELVRVHPLRPIRSAAGLDRAVEVLNGLIDRGDLGPGEREYQETAHPDRALRG